MTSFEEFSEEFPEINLTSDEADRTVQSFMFFIAHLPLDQAKKVLEHCGLLRHSDSGTDGAK